jgi:hypothetical protein
MDRIHRRVLDVRAVGPAVFPGDRALRLVVKGFKPSPITIATTATDSTPVYHRATA